MARLAIIGGGIVGKSLLFSLAKEKRQKYDSVTLYESDALAPACTWQSTAIVAARGVLPGLSPLGDKIHEGIKLFSEHVEADSPRGVYPIKQLSGALEKKDAFFRRYQNYQENNSYKEIKLSQILPLHCEDAFYVEPRQYCQWLWEESSQFLNVSLIKDFVTSVNAEGEVKTLSGREDKFDHIILASGVKNQIWSGLVLDPKLKKSKSVRGSFLLFSEVDLYQESYSLSVDDMNFIYRRESRELLIGATSQETRLYELHPEVELTRIYHFFEQLLSVSLPPISKARICTGMREKASKREPYSGQEGRISFLGGLYKNGFTLSLKMATDVVRQLP